MIFVEWGQRGKGDDSKCFAELVTRLEDWDWRRRRERQEALLSAHLLPWPSSLSFKNSLSQWNIAF